jgi:uncharacterized protein (TIGR00645 family)
VSGSNSEDGRRHQPTRADRHVGPRNFATNLGKEEHEDRPGWLGEVASGALKLKLVAPIVAISGIHLLKTFLEIYHTRRGGAAP